MDPCTTKPIPGAAQALLRPDRIAVDISDPDEWGDVHITIGRDERLRLTSAVQQYRIDAPSTGGDPIWLTRGQLVALIAAGQALLEPRKLPVRKGSAQAAKAAAAATPAVEAETPLGVRLRPSQARLQAIDRMPICGPLQGVALAGCDHTSDLITSRTGASSLYGLRNGFGHDQCPLDAPDDLPSGSHRTIPSSSVGGTTLVLADIRRGRM